MDFRSIEYVRQACEGELTGGSAAQPVRRVCTDSRQVQPGDLFIALRGERFDGHNFLAEVGSKAVAVVVERQWAPALTGNCAVIAVDDTRKALGRLAAAYRGDFELPLVAVGGSNGKTSTKELVAAVLRQKLNTLWSEASFNNDIGVPLTLLKLEHTHQVAVVEAGTNHPGELEPLVRMIRPAYGVITSIGREHLEFFGDLEGVAREEGWLAELLPPGAKLLLNGDSEWAPRLAARTGAAIVRVGQNEGNEWRVRSVRLDKQGVTFRIEAPRADFAGEYRIFLMGRHQASNALFAIALGAELGLSRAEVERGLAEAKPAKMRLQLWELNGIRVLDDAYNANADSMAAALQTLQELPCRGRRVAVLGDMAELGPHSEAAHEEVGRRAAELGVGQLFAVGKMAPVMARGARGAGLSRVLEFADVDTAAIAIKQFVRQGDVLLLKASRAARFERVAELLRGDAGEEELMLYYLSQHLLDWSAETPWADSLKPLRLFRYITVRSAGAALTALALSLWLGPKVIAWLKQLKFGQDYKDKAETAGEMKTRLLSKKGTPTMGGILIVLALNFTTLLWAQWNSLIELTLLSVVVLTGLGFYDDYAKIIQQSGGGAKSHVKLWVQTVLALFIGFYLWRVPATSKLVTEVMVPFYKYPVATGAGVIGLVLTLLTIVGSSNAVNLTDGLDGLAIGCTLIVSFVFLVLTYVAGHKELSGYLFIPYVPGAGELTVFCAAMVGAGLGFLWFNCHPAQMFMGDTGSLALGGALGIIAVLIHQPLVLVIAGGVFVMEAGSVILQTGWFRFTRRRYGTGQRIFLMAPLHHHFEKKGWYESQVVMRFYILGVLCAVVALSTLKIR